MASSRTPDFQKLCAQLLEAYEWCIDEYMTAPASEDTLVQRARAALAQLEPEIVPKNCWLDDEPDIWPSSCVFEDPEEVISNCAYASVLHFEGKCKTDCQHYREPTSEEN
jgi:hypothetical protein